MASFKFRLGKKSKKTNTYPILLYLSHKGKETTYNLTKEFRDFQISNVKDWNVNKEIFNGNGSSIKDNNKTLSLLRNRIREILTEFNNNNILSNELDVIRLKDYVLKNLTKGKSANNGNFEAHWNACAELHPKSSDKYKYAFAVVKRVYQSMYGDTPMVFSNITYDFIKNVLSWLIENPTKYGDNGYKYLSKNTAYSYKSTFKAVINRAIDEGLLNAELVRAFKAVKISQPRTNIPFTIGIDKIREIMQYDFRKEHKYNYNKEYFCKEILARDMFILSFCLQGLNMKDFYEMTIKNVQNNGKTFALQRAKTGVNIIINLGDTISLIQPILNKYLTSKPDKIISYVYDTNQEYYFNFANHWRSYNYFYEAIGKGMRKIREALEIPNLKMYTARYSWCTIASNVYGLEEQSIDLGIGHSPRTMASRFYIQPDINKVSETTQKIIRDLFSEETAD